MGWTVGLQPPRVGHLGCVWDVPELPGTLEWEDCSYLEWDTWDVPELPGTLGWDGLSGHVCDVPGLPGTLHGMDSEVGAI